MTEQKLKYAEQRIVYLEQQVATLKQDKARLLSERHGGGTMTCQVCGVRDDEEETLYLKSAEMFLCPQCVGETEESEGGAAGICGKCRVQGDVPLTYREDIDKFLCSTCLGLIREFPDGTIVVLKGDELDQDKIYFPVGKGTVS